MLLFLICVAAIVVLLLDIKTVQRNRYILIRIICTILFIASIIRYITVLLFANGVDIQLLKKMQRFYFATFVGITLSSAIVLWYITPKYREKLKFAGLLFLYIPWVVFYILLCIYQPFEIIKSTTSGYALQLTGNWNIYLSILQFIFIVTFITAAVYGSTLYKHRQVRSQYFVLIMCQLLFLVDVILYWGFGTPAIPPFTLTEVFGFLGIYYGLVKPPIDARGIYN